LSAIAVVAYPDLATARRVRRELLAAVREGHAHLEDAVVLERTLDGGLRLHRLGSKVAGDGVDDDGFLTDLGERLRPGTTALIVLGSAEARDEIIERVKPYRGELLQASLSSRELERLRGALAKGASHFHGST
jgi:uncharacterized membrane protein